MFEIKLQNQASFFENIFKVHHQKVYQIAISMLKNAEDAEDITQEVFINIFHAIHQFKEEAQITTWIYRITVNKCLDHIKSKKRKKRLAFITSLFDPTTGKQIHDAQHLQHPGAILEQKETQEILLEALAQLKLRQQTAFILSQIEKLSQKEIAAILDISEKAVESLIQRAKEKLRIILGNYYQNRRL